MGIQCVALEKILPSKELMPIMNRLVLTHSKNGFQPVLQNPFGRTLQQSDISVLPR
jgi:hypothetical protein